jgi:hypothetical protein
MSIKSAYIKSKVARILPWTTAGNRATFLDVNTFVGTNEYNSKYIGQHPKPTNIG